MHSKKAGTGTLTGLFSTTCNHRFSENARFHSTAGKVVLCIFGTVLSGSGFSLLALISRFIMHCTVGRMLNLCAACEIILPYIWNLSNHHLFDVKCHGARGLLTVKA